MLNTSASIVALPACTQFESKVTKTESVIGDNSSSKIDKVNLSVEPASMLTLPESSWLLVKIVSWIS